MSQNPPDDEDLPPHRYPPEGSEPGVADSPEEFREQLKQYLKYRQENGNTFVKGTHIQTEFGVHHQKASANLRQLVDEGFIEPFFERSEGTVWKITLCRSSDEPDSSTSE